MALDRRRPDVTLVTIAAFAGLAWALIALAYASLAPAQYVPRIFQNYHVEHFAAFYIVALLSSAALPRARLEQISVSLALLAAVFAGFRITTLVHRLFYAEDLLCDLAGIFAALTPMAVSHFRQISRTQSN